MSETYGSDGVRVACSRDEKGKMQREKVYCLTFTTIGHFCMPKLNLYITRG